MTNAITGRFSPAFVLHALGGVTFYTFLLRFLLSPMDLFVHQTYLRAGLVQSAVAGSIFYGFSLSLLWRRPLSTGWGVAYAAACLLLLVLVFTPVPTGGAGMMRRVAYPERYGDFQATMQRIRMAFQLGLGIVFLWVQAVFLRTMFRPVPRLIPPPLPR